MPSVADLSNLGEETIELGAVSKDASMSAMPPSAGLSSLGGLPGLMKQASLTAPESKLHQKYTFMPISSLQKSISTQE